jgi:hypothetical protein
VRFLPGVPDLVRALLADRSPEGLFWDWPGDTEVVLARRELSIM